MTGPSWRRYLRFWRDDVTADVDDELEFHLASRAQELTAAGMSADAARVEALRRFGNLERVRERCAAIDDLHDRDRRRADAWDALHQDLRYAGRMLRRSPGFTLVAAVTMTLGIGANTAIFSVVNGVLLRPLPYPEADRLVRLYTAFRGSGTERYSMSQPEFLDYKGLTHVFENAAAFTGNGLTLTGGCTPADGRSSTACDPMRVRGVAATRDLLPVLHVTPLRGRNFQGEDGRNGREPVVIVSYEFWQQQFGGDPSLLGRSLTLNGVSRRVIGILPPDAAIDRADVLTPLFINPDSLAGRATNYLSGVARLRPDITIEHAQRELNGLTRRIAAEYRHVYAPNAGYGATVISMREVIVGDVRQALLILMGVVGLVLLIACANVANLLLARASAREREMAVRMAIGAGHGRIVRQLLTESVLLSLIGAVGGVLLAWWGMKTLLAVNPTAIPRFEAVRIDATVGGVTLALAVLTGILFGLAPALQLVRTQLDPALRAGARGGSASRGQQRLGRILVIGEMALAVVIVVAASLLVKSYRTLKSVNLGVDATHLLVIDLALPAARYDDNATTTFYQQLVEQIGALPGVRVAAAASDLPPVAGQMNWDIFVEGQPRAAGDPAPSPNIRAVTSQYFRTLGIPVVLGRVFGAEDGRTSAPVAVVNETAVRTIWRGRSPVGQRLRFSNESPWVTVVGVARDVHSTGLDEPPPAELYLVHEQLPVIGERAQRTMYVVARTAGDPSALTTPARRLVRALDPTLAITGINTMGEMIDFSVARPRFTMLLLGVFGAVALVLAAVGIYGVMSFAVKRRTREIGIRMALGARPADVMGLVMGQGMRVALLGLVTGIIGAALATRLMRGLLFGVSASDPVTFAGIALVLAGVSFLATWVPARRAVLTDPTTALRTD